MKNLTLEQVKHAAPSGNRKMFTQKHVDNINNMLKTEEAREEIKENIIGYIGVLAEGRYQVKAYIQAVKYVSHKLMGDSNLEAYSKTFPERIQHFVTNNTEARHIAGHVSIYNKGILVNKIMEQSMVPTYVLNMDMYQSALNVQAELMIGAKSETVRSNAADSILTHLKRPEAQKIDISIGLEEDDSIKELRDTTLQLVAQQKMMIKAGAMSVKEVAHSKVIRDDVIDVEVIEDGAENT